jgi:hypothetical protein
MAKKKFSKTPINMDMIDFEINAEWFGLASSTKLPHDTIDGLKSYLNNAVNVFVSSNYIRLIREYQDGLDRGCNFRLHPNVFYTTEQLSDPNSPWDSSKYIEYFDRNYNEIPRPKNAKYAKGDIVMVSNEDNLGVAIVLGGICEDRGDIRLDLCGVTSMSHIRHATKEDILSDSSKHGKRIRIALNLT